MADNSKQPLETKFAPAERLSAEEVARQADILKNSDIVRGLFETVPELLLVLNRERQILYANKTLATLFGISDVSGVLGFRPGEVLNCIHSHECNGGCGTSEACSTCGAILAILSALNGKPDTRECRVTVVRDGKLESMELRAAAVPVVVGGEHYTALYLADISAEKRRTALERVFFHDILNTAGAISGNAELLAEGVTEEEGKELVENLLQLSERMISEIKSQRILLSAERHELSINPVSIDGMELVKRCIKAYSSNSCLVEMDSDSEPVKIVSDKALLERILSNMIKNACEALAAGEKAVVSCRREGEKVRFSVHNPKAMSKEVQLQVFHRSFSTKGPGRGLGTYSMRLLSENHLKGKVYFESTPEKGTTFYAEYPLSL